MIRHTVAATREEWDAKVLPLLRGRVFHVTPEKGFDGISADGQIRSDPNGALGTGFISTSPSFARYYGLVSFSDLRAKSEQQIRDNSQCYWPEPAERAFYLILREDACSKLISNSEISTRPLPEGIGLLNYVPVTEACYPAPVSLGAIESVIEVIREPSPPTELEQLFDLYGWDKG